MSKRSYVVRNGGGGEVEVGVGGDKTGHLSNPVQILYGNREQFYRRSEGDREEEEVVDGKGNDKKDRWGRIFQGVQENVGQA